jgi:hypothetical protein
MEIETGKIFVNKTWKYLMPVTREYGPTFKAKFQNVWKLVVGIGDAYYNTKGKRCLFILIDRKWYPEKVKNTLDWVKNQPYYVDDYPFDDLLKGRQHMIVIEFPTAYVDSYNNFLKGKYSEMFNAKEVDKFFKTQTVKDAYYVLTRSTEAYDKFIKNIQLTFKSDVKKSDLLDSELDFPPEERKEIFNYGAI